jgi:hypothetical protein
MKVQNGIHVYEKGDPPPPVPNGLPIDFPVISRFGFKVVEVTGRPCWEAASEAEFRQSESVRLGVKPEDVPVSSDPNSCKGNLVGCFGACSFGFCTNVVDVKRRLYYCTCVIKP